MPLPPPYSAAALDLSSLPGSDNVLSARLPNGIEVRIRESQASPTVAIEGLVHAGTLYEQPGEAGWAKLVAELMERGTVKRPFGRLWSTLEDLGAEVGFGAGRHTLGFDARCLAEDLRPLVTVLADMLTQPAFAPRQVALSRSEALTGLAERDHDTTARAGLAFRALLYGPEHPYGRDPEGGAAALGTITPAGLAQWHARVVHPADSILAVVGAVDAPACLQLLAETFGAWEPAGPPPSRPVVVLPPASPQPRRSQVALTGKHQADLVVGVVGIPRQHPDWTAAALANVTLGVFGFMGRLGERVRDQLGLAYSVYSRLVGGLGPGPWYAAAGVNPRRVDAALTAILDAVHRLQDEPLSPTELADVQAYVIGALPLLLETNDGVAQALVDIVLYDLGPDYLRHYAERIHAVTAADVQRAAQHFATDSCAVAVAGP
jgi:zinc protease